MTKANFKYIYDSLNTRKPITSIYGAYSKPSINKVNAFNNCESDRIAHDEYNQSIIGSNCYIFTYAYLYKVGTVERLVYITPSHRYDVCVDTF